MRAAVPALWSVLEAGRADNPAERDDAAAKAAEALRDEPLELAIERDRLLVDGTPALAGMDTFAAIHGLRAFLRDAGIERAHFAAGCAATALRSWAELVVACVYPRQWPEGIEVEHRDGAPSDALPTALLKRRPTVPEPADSRLRSVFLQHRLIAELPTIRGVAPADAKRIVQGVVERLLRVDGGLEPLILLQQDAALLQRSTAVAVLTVLFARRLGWPSEHLADLGALGLLHDLGSVVDGTRPGVAGFAWLLERGDDDFWLRCALAARSWREGHRAATEPAGPLVSASLVRAAVAAYRDGPAGIEELMQRGELPAAIGVFAQRALSYS